LTNNIKRGKGKGITPGKTHNEHGVLAESRVGVKKSLKKKGEIGRERREAAGRVSVPSTVKPVGPPVEGRKRNHGFFQAVPSLRKNPQRPE